MHRNVPVTLISMLCRNRSSDTSASGSPACGIAALRSEEHTSELQSLMRISYAVFCLKKKQKTKTGRTRKRLTEGNTHPATPHTQAKTRSRKQTVLKA